MKILRFALLGFLFIASLNVSNTYGQLSRAKALARRVAPSPAPAPQRNPYPASPYSRTPVQANPAPPAATPPAPTPAPQPVTPVPTAPIAVRPAAPVDPAKVQAQNEETVRKTVEFQKKRAEEGSSVAQYDLGLRYLKGDGVEKDEEAGRKWLEKSAKDGNTQASKKLKELNETKN